MLGNASDFHAQVCGVTGYVSAYACKPHEAEGRSSNLARAVVLLPDCFLSPNPVLLKAYRLRDPLGHGEHHGDDMLGDHGAMHLTGVGQNDVTIHEFRKQKLMDGGGGRVYPV